MKRFCMIAAALAIGLMMTGCSQEPEAAYPLAERTAALADLLPDKERRAPSFASGICVIRGDEPQPEGGVEAEAAAVFSLSDHSVILQKNGYERLYPASTTKVMTALLAIRNGNLDDQVTVGDETVITEAGASLCHIKPGDTLTLRQLLYGLMLPSGNDAGAAIAVHIAGSMEAFSDMMNDEARRIGATDSHFVNPHGLHDENHYTTPYDLYLIFQEALKEPEFREIIASTSYDAVYTDAEGNSKTQTWKNSNQYLTGEQTAPDGLTVLGGKTGTTKKAGSCLIIASQDDEGREYVSVIMKDASRDKLYADMTNIIQKIVK